MGSPEREGLDMRKGIGVGLSLVALSGIAGLGAACVTSSGGGAQGDAGFPEIDATFDSGGGSDAAEDTIAPGDSGGHPDATTPGDSASPGDSSAPEADAGSDATSSDAGGDGGPTFSVAATVTLPDYPQRLAGNPTTNKLYVMLSNGGTVGGISVVDGASATVDGPMGATTDAGAPVFFDDITVDPVNNLVYGAFFRTVWVFSGATRALLGTIDLSQVSVGSPSARIYGLAVDGTAKKLYALIGYITGAQTVSVIDTSAGVGTPGPAISLSDFVVSSSAHDEALAVDTENHLLFASGTTLGDAGQYVPAVDTISTTSNTVSAPQLTFNAFGSLGVAGTPGFAAMVTTAGPSAPPAIQALEPGTVDLPTNKTWTSFSLQPSSRGVKVLVWGYDAMGIPSFLTQTFCGEQSIGQGGFWLPRPGDLTGSLLFTSTILAGHPWVATAPIEHDAGPAPKQVTELTVPADALAFDGGCPDGG